MDIDFDLARRHLGTAREVADVTAVDEGKTPSSVTESKEPKPSWQSLRLAERDWLQRVITHSNRMAVDETYRLQIAKHLS